MEVGSFRLRDVSLDCAAGAHRVLLGPTGSGKSTLLRCILGLAAPDAGAVLWGDEDVSRVPPEARRFGYVPQHRRLFPHLTVEENVLFGARRQGLDARERRRRLEALAGPLGLGALLGRRVEGLSGGEAQKAALARALAVAPRALLLDEPFSAIDEGARRLLWFDLRDAIERAGLPVLHVTHNLDEACTLGRRISVMIDGAVVQEGAPAEILERPASEAVARLLDYRNVFRGRAVPAPDLGGAACLDAGGFRLALPAGTREGALSVCVRPQDVKIIREGEPVREEIRANVFPCVVVSLLSLPDYALMRVRLDGSRRDFDLEARLPGPVARRHGVETGRRLRVGIWTPGIIVFSSVEAPGTNDLPEVRSSLPSRPRRQPR